MNLNLSALTRYGLNCLGLLGVSIALYFGSSIFIPLTMAGLLAALLYPMARGLHEKLWMPWFLACLSAITILVVFATAVLLIIVLSVPQFVNRLPTTEEGPTGWKARYTAVAKNLQSISPYSLEKILPVDAGDSNFYKSVRRLFDPDQIAETIKGMVAFGFQQVTELILILFIVLFLLMESELLGSKVRAIFGTSRDHQNRVTQAIAAIADSIRTYLYWRTLINFGLALALGLFYKYVCHLEQYVLWGVLTFVFNYIPYIGPLAAGAPPVLEAFLLGEPLIALLIVVVYLVVTTLEGYLIVPWVMGRSLDLNATTVMVACLYWHLVWGVAGLFLAMPLMAMVKVVLMHVDGWGPIGDLLGSEPVKPAENSSSEPTSPDMKTEPDLLVVPQGDGEATMEMPPLPELTPKTKEAGGQP
jgi:AI-2 transport protein TqsA